VAESKTRPTTPDEVKANAKDVPTGDHDRVVMATRNPDGSPRQSADFEFIGPKDVAEAHAKEQLAQLHVSAADTAIRGVTSPADEPGEPDAFVKPIKDAHEKAVKAAHARAEAEVAERHNGLGD
jgi:hypothetical protein